MCENKKRWNEPSERYPSHRTLTNWKRFSSGHKNIGRNAFYQTKITMTQGFLTFYHRYSNKKTEPEPDRRAIRLINPQRIKLFQTPVDNVVHLIQYLWLGLEFKRPVIFFFLPQNFAKKIHCFNHFFQSVFFHGFMVCVIKSKQTVNKTQARSFTFSLINSKIIGWNQHFA